MLRRIRLLAAVLSLYSSSSKNLLSLIKSMLHNVCQSEKANPLIQLLMPTVQLFMS